MPAQPIMADDAARLKAEIRSLEEQLVAEHRMASIGRLLAAVVHEINSPIGSIFSNNEVTLRSVERLRALLADPRPENSAKAAAIADNVLSLASVDKIACERISSVIRGLKTFARVDAAERRKANLNEGLRDTLKLMQAEFRRRVSVVTDFGEIPAIECYQIGRASCRERV